MNALYEKHRTEAEFLLVYILEVHPVDSWKYSANEKDGIRVTQPKTFQERQGVAQVCGRALDVKFPTVIDGMDNMTERDYAAWPERLYIVGWDGRIGYKSRSGSQGFRIEEMAEALAGILQRGAGDR